MNTFDEQTANSEVSKWLTVPEAAAVARVGWKAIYKEVAAGRLRASRIGGRRDIRIHSDWVHEWLQASSCVGTPATTHQPVCKPRRRPGGEK